MVRLAIRASAGDHDLDPFRHQLQALFDRIKRATSQDDWRQLGRAMSAISWNSNHDETDPILRLRKHVRPIVDSLVAAARALGTPEPGDSFDEFGTAIHDERDGSASMDKLRTHVDRLGHSIALTRGSRDVLRTAVEEVAGTLAVVLKNEPASQERIRQITESIATVSDTSDLEKLRQKLLSEAKSILHEATARNAKLEEVQSHVLDARQRVKTLELQLRSAREAATTDPLTGLGNRRALEERVRVLSKMSSTAAVLTLDVDRFKLVNDTYGHDGGDLVLRHVGKILQTEIRGEDRAFRVGGEEFTVILASATTESALQVAERLRQAIARDTVPIGRANVRATASVGVALWDSGLNFAEVSQEADQALYAAKRQGRDRVILAK